MGSRERKSYPVDLDRSTDDPAQVDVTLAELHHLLDNNLVRITMTNGISKAGILEAIADKNRPQVGLADDRVA